TLTTGHGPMNEWR
ncbi:hypothetical protein MKD33_12940, partial [Chromobacterium piscinae]